MDQLVVQLIDRVNELAENGAEDVTGVRTGFYDLDRLTAGLQPGDLIVLAARPSMGKTAFALNIAENVAVNEGMPVVVFSMEMGASQLALRMVGSLGRIDQQHLRTGALRDDEWGRLSEAVDKLGKAPVFIDESPALNSSELRARARRQARQCGRLGLIVVDYLQLMSGSSTSEENRATEIGEISRGLKALAKELQCPVIALSQLNRSVETRNDKRPMMSDLRESGAIEQDADVIMFIYRDDYYNKDASKEPGVAEIIIGKQRNGPVGTVKLTFLKPLTRVRQPGAWQQRQLLSDSAAEPVAPGIRRSTVYIYSMKDRCSDDVPAMPIAGPLKGRGTAWAIEHRYSKQHHEAFDDGWGTLDQEAAEEHVAPETQVIEERVRSVIATNDSPDIAFDLSMNPYRGCEHGCVYCFARPTHSFLEPVAGPRLRDTNHRQGQRRRDGCAKRLPRRATSLPCSTSVRRPMPISRSSGDFESPAR